MKNQIEIYQTPNHQTKINVRFEEETVWLSQKMMADLFDKDSDTISLHLKNIYSEGELDENATTEFFSVVQTEGKRIIKRNHLSLPGRIPRYHPKPENGIQIRPFCPTQRPWF